LKTRPRIDSKNWSLNVFCNIYWAGDPETRISVTDFILYFQNVPVCWRLEAQRGVTLSSSKAEYVEMSEAVKNPNLSISSLRYLDYGGPANCGQN
jgi:hypothetical protein